MPILILVLFFALAASAAEPGTPAPTALGDPVRAMEQFRLPAGFKAELFASEPHLANPVAFTIDNQGSFYVAETHRHSPVGAAFRLYEGVLDIRSHLDWLDDDLALQSVPERTQFLVQKLGTNIAKFTEKSEILRLIQDKNGDGKADSSSVFANGFNKIPDGIAAGVLARDGKVVFASIPDLWELKDTNNDGKADQRQILHTGYGVHVSFIGHDLHGLVMGLDGRLYFSIGDRALNVTNKEGRVLFYPDEGVVLRCELDGSNLEVFARGLRNPQELAFDDYGNLFTGDNNSDGGDRARWVHVVEGGDSGWRIGYQHMHAPPRRGPWNAEKLWYPQWTGQAAYIVPPIANLGYGPSGLAYYPGAGLPDKYRNHFFLCDFRGGASSGIHTFSLKPKGASFEIASYEQFLWEALPTDVEFGPDGAMYFTDWIQGRNKTDAGRIYRVFHPETRRSPITLETRRILRDGLRDKDDGSLTALFSHPDRRVRLEAQFELVRRGTNSLNAIHAFLRDQGSISQQQPSLVHALWALGQLGRSHREKAPEFLNPVRTYLTSAPAEIRAVAAQVFADAGVSDVAPQLIESLSESNSAVLFSATMALAKLRIKDAVAPALEMVEQNADRDPFLRHAGVMVLSSCATASELEQVRAASDASKLALIVALRRLESPLLAKFLASSNLLVALEAARAINDTPLSAAFPVLAELLNHPTRFEPSATNKVEVIATDAITASISSVVPETGSTTPYEQLYQRAINANFRLGERKNASALADFSLNARVPESLRSEALHALADWAEPSGRDRIVGLWRPLPSRSTEIAEREIASRLKQIFPKAPEQVQLAALEAIRKLRILKADSTLLGLVRGNLPQLVRLKALNTLAGLNSKRIEQALTFANNSDLPALVAEARLIRAKLNPEASAVDLARVLKTGSIKEKQQVLDTIAQIPSPALATLVQKQMVALLAQQSAPELSLDILNAASKQGTPELLDLVKKFESDRPRTPMGPFTETLHGGNAEAGRKIFYERAEVFCSRCHIVGNEGGMAGPNLTGIGSRQGREYILESIILPNKQLAKGFENVLVTLNDGSSYSGAVEKESTDELVINSPEDGEVRVKKSEVKSRERALSGMPEEFRQILTKQDLRDLVEYLSMQK